VLVVIGRGKNASASQSSAQVNITGARAARVVPIENFKPFNGVQTASIKNDVPGDYVPTIHRMAKELQVGTT